MRCNFSRLVYNVLRCNGLFCLPRPVSQAGFAAEKLHIGVTPLMRLGPLGIKPMPFETIYGLLFHGPRIGQYPQSVGDGFYPDDIILLHYQCKPDGGPTFWEMFLLFVTLVR